MQETIRLHLALAGLTLAETREITEKLVKLPGVQGVEPFHRHLESGSLEIKASAHSEVALLIAFAVGQITPGAQEFTKAIGKKAGDAIGDVLVTWFKKRFPQRGDQATALLDGADGEPIKTLQGKR